MTPEERLAVLESQITRLQHDTEELYDFIRKHMEDEDKRWKEIHAVVTRWKGFMGGIVFTISAVWAAIAAALHYFK